MRRRGAVLLSGLSGDCIVIVMMATTGRTVMRVVVIVRVAVVVARMRMSVACGGTGVGRGVNVLMPRRDENVDEMQRHRKERDQAEASVKHGSKHGDEANFIRFSPNGWLRVNAIELHFHPTGQEADTRRAGSGPPQAATKRLPDLFLAVSDRSQVPIDLERSGRFSY